MSPRARFLLPGLLVLVALVCVRLGVWQVHRLRQRRSANAAAFVARTAPVVDLDTTRVPAGSALANRRVRASGRYDRGHEVVLRGVTFEEGPGVQVVTPLVLSNGAAILVKRGFVPAPDAVSAHLQGLDEPGSVRVTGIALPIQSHGDRGAPLTRAGQVSWRTLDLAALRARMPYPLFGVYVMQAPDSSLPRIPRRLPPAALDDGPHLSYALQWFGFAATALIVAAILAFRSPGRSVDHPAPR